MKILMDLLTSWKHKEAFMVEPLGYVNYGLLFQPNHLDISLTIKAHGDVIRLAIQMIMAQPPAFSLGLI